MGRMVKFEQVPVKVGIAGLVKVCGADVFDPAPKTQAPDPE